MVIHLTKALDIGFTDTYFVVAHIHPLPILILFVIIVVPFWTIFRKAGFSGALSLLMFIPIVNILLLYILAYSRWKAVSPPLPADSAK